MNAEKVYSSAYEALVHYLTVEREAVNLGYALAHPGDFKANPIVYNLIQLVNSSMDEIEKKKPTGSVRSAMKAIIKNAIKNNPARVNTHGAWIESDGWQVVCDGYRCIRVRNPVDGLPKTDMELDTKSIIAASKNNPDYISFDLPDMGMVKAKLVELKANKKGLFYSLGEELPWVNAQYLLDMAPFAGCTWYYNPKSLLSAIYFTSDDVEGALLPTRAPKQT